MNVDAMSRSGHDPGDEDSGMQDERISAIMFLALCANMTREWALATMGWTNHGNSVDAVYWHERMRASVSGSASGSSPLSR